MSTYAYSYNRDDFVGRFPTREAALAEALKNHPQQMDSPIDIYVGVIIDADPQATDHAEKIIDSMARRAHVDIGESAVDYLKHVTPEQKRELDEWVAETILAWLKRHDLMPKGWRQVRSITEHHPEDAPREPAAAAPRESASPKRDAPATPRKSPTPELAMSN